MILNKTQKMVLSEILSEDATDYFYDSDYSLEEIKEKVVSRLIEVIKKEVDIKINRIGE